MGETPWLQVRLLSKCDSFQDVFRILSDIMNAISVMVMIYQMKAALNNGI